MVEGLIAAWRACQQRVDELERLYAAAMLAYTRGEGPPPAAETRTELLAARKQAKELLARALAAIDGRMQELDRNHDSA